MSEEKAQTAVKETAPNHYPAQREHLAAYSWKPGQSGNPAGRPKGARSKLSERAIDDIYTTWQEGGIDALRKLRDTEPGKYIAAVVSLIPKQIEAEHNLQVKVSSAVDSLVLKLASLAQRDAEYEAVREASLAVEYEEVADELRVTRDTEKSG